MELEQILASILTGVAIALAVDLGLFLNAAKDWLQRN